MALAEWRKMLYSLRMDKLARIESLKSRIADIDAWLDKHRDERPRRSLFVKNQGVAHKLRSELCWLRDPALAQAIYPR